MTIPSYVLQTLNTLDRAGFEAYIVGGCVRDLLRGVLPHDWDITTKARPEEILKVFPDGKYENEFGTVILPLKEKDGSLIAVLEITTYRSEQGYSDRRHPDEIRFETVLEKDLERRDFTVNALALTPKELTVSRHQRTLEIDGQNYTLVDLFGGEKDLEKKIIRAVGEPTERFKEDALRMMRALRFASQFDFALEPKTQRAIVKLAGNIKFVSKERIRDELIKIMASEQPGRGIRLLEETKLLQYIVPELSAGVGVPQSRHHIYPVFEHNVRTLENCVSKKWTVRLAALFHDIGKTKTRREIDGIATFYNHEYLGAKMTRKIMDRLRFSRADIEAVVNLVKNHMFYYQVGEVTAASVRRLIAKVGRDNLQDLIYLRMADRLGSGTPKALPYKLKHLQYMMEKVQHDPISVKMLQVNGNDLQTELSLNPGPKIGAVLDVLLAKVLEDPERNTRAYLLNEAMRLKELDLAALREEAQDLIAEKQDEEDKKIKSKYLRN